MKYLLFISLLFLEMTVIGQDLENIKNNKPVTVSGGFNVNLSGYKAIKMDNRRDPYSWDLSGNINLNVYGVLDLPFSVYLSKRNTTYNQPSFQQFGMSPKYRGVTVHAGYRSMQFSSYSLSGATFLGGGVEIQPKNSWIRGKFLYGRFIKAIPAGDTINPRVNLPAFERWGYGSMVTIGKTDNSIDLFLFKAKDEATFAIPDSIDIKPMENLVIGFITRQKLLKRFSINVEYNLSALTKDIRMPEKKFDNYTYVNNLGELFTPRYSSTFNKAVSTTLDYQGDGFACGVSFKLVDPGYQSLGALYLTNDLMDYTVNVSKSFVKNKITVNGSIGQQVNNLEKNLNRTNTRTISSFSVSYTINKSLNASANYSDFNANSSPVKILLNDSIKLAQISRNLGGTLSYSTGGKNFQHSTSINTNIQTANTINGTEEVVSKSSTDMKNGNLNYRITYKPIDLSLNSSYNYSEFTADSAVNITRGPVFGLSKAFLKKKMSVNMGFSLLGSYVGNRKEGDVNVLNAGISYRLGKHHSIRMNNSTLFKSNRDYTSGEIKKKYETKGSLSYSYNF